MTTSDGKNSSIMKYNPDMLTLLPAKREFKD